MTPGVSDSAGVTAGTPGRELPGTAGFTEPAPRSSEAAGSSSGQSSPGLLSELSGVAGSVQRALSGFFDLVVLEARRAGLSLVWMVALGFGAAILGVSAWLGLVATLVFCAMAMGLSPILSMLLVVVLNLAGAAGAVYACMKFSKDLLFTASRRQLSTDVSAPPPQP